MAVLSSCWCMLATTIPLPSSAASAPHAIHRLLPTLNTCSSVTARTSIASSIGFCFALCHRSMHECDEHESFAELSSLQEAVEAALHDGISESSKKRSKTDKKQQKAAFRIALASVQGCDFDSERLIVTSPSGNAVADISTWTMHAQVEAQVQAYENGCGCGCSEQRTRRLEGLLRHAVVGCDMQVTRGSRPNDGVGPASMPGWR